ncbi:pseudouridine synthase [Amylocystis lapponica]|nr:pseudouridine synthase [Amylocystis lapponica]
MDVHKVEENSLPTTSPGLKKIPPYWYPYTTMAKGRWLGREILEVVSTEFRDRSMEYYRYALESGVTTINGKVAKPDTIVQNGDRIENVVHRHEPPVTSTPVRILHHDKEREFIVIDKPGSIPVHATGRYFRNSLVEILKNDFGFTRVHTINRLDRLTSGLMIIPLSPAQAVILSREFAAGSIRKEYIARCKGEFPEEEITCEEPLLTVDRQMGLNIVHPDGKPAKTLFKRLRFDANTQTSVVRCRPLTGRSHQIRVHLQWLGYPIANDPIYSEIKIWGSQLGKGGVDLTPSEERTAPRAPAQFSFDSADNPESLSHSHVQDNESIGRRTVDAGEEELDAVQMTRQKLLPRETGHDIGMGSPVPLSAEMVGIITRLRNTKDEDEDWSRWRDVVFRAKGRLSPYGVKIPLPQKRRKPRGVSDPEPADASDKSGSNDGDVEPAQLTTEEVLAKLESFKASPVSSSFPVPAPVESAFAAPFPPAATGGQISLAADTAEAPLYCPECYLPMHPDPKPERLYIFLHALQYTTSLGCFATEMPEWAAEGWVWES